jgi:hypothetical protein
MAPRWPVSRIVGAPSEWVRKPSDFYSTPADVTQALCDAIKRILPKGSLVWEPACGVGAMSWVLERNGYEVVSTDLRRTGYGVGGCDFLQGDGIPFSRIDAVISNPPFSLAEEFIFEAMTLGEPLVVAFLLKSSYWHAAGRRPLFMKYEPSIIMPLTWRPAFLEEERGSSPLMDVCWNIWIKDEDFCPSYYPCERTDVTSDEPLEVKLARLYGAIEDLTEALA